MAIESPLKKEAELAGKEIEILNRHYNMYFSGADEDPPRDKRRDLDLIFQKLKQKLPITPNASDKFFASSIISRYQVFCSKWDKQMKNIEDGKVIRPNQRKNLR